MYTFLVVLGAIVVVVLGVMLLLHGRQQDMDFIPQKNTFIPSVQDEESILREPELSDEELSRILLDNEEGLKAQLRMMEESTRLPPGFGGMEITI